MKIAFEFNLTNREKRIVALIVGAGVLAASGVALAGGVPKVWSDGDTLNAADLNGNFSALDGRISAIEASQIVWSSYTPTIESDGTAASQVVRGTTIRYFVQGKTVCLQGHVVFGEQFPGSGGSYIRISLPAGYDGASGVDQYGVGTVLRTGDSTTLFDHGSGAVLSAQTGFITLTKESSGLFANADARAGAGILWIADGCYQTN